jgi:cholesterol transport system auxiliary component
MKRGVLVSATVLYLALLSGCGAARPSKFYQLTIPDERTATDPAAYPVTLLLGPITTSHLYRDDRIVYTSSGQAMGTYEYARWAEPPTEMIGDLLLRELRSSRRYQSVYSRRSDVRGDYLLRGQLYDFREVSGKGLVARVAFEFDLQDSKTGVTVWTGSYAHDEPAAANEVSAVVAAMDRNVQNGLGEISRSLEQYFASQPHDPPVTR